MNRSPLFWRAVAGELLATTLFLYITLTVSHRHHQSSSPPPPRSLFFVDPLSRRSPFLSTYLPTVCHVQLERSTACCCHQHLLMFWFNHHHPCLLLCW